MELKCKVIYHSSFGSLYPGDTTEGKGYPEDKKQELISDFPDWFEIINDESKAPEKKPRVK